MADLPTIGELSRHGDARRVEPDAALYSTQFFESHPLARDRPVEERDRTNIVVQLGGNDESRYEPLVERSEVTEGVPDLAHARARR